MQRLFLVLTAIAATLTLEVSAATTFEPSNNSEVCSPPVLSSLKKHVVKPGETLKSIAKQYELTDATLMGLNPDIRDRTVKVGKTILIPSINGLSHDVENEETYKSIANKYRVRADLIFEQNGCQNRPKTVFVPGAIWRPAPTPIAPLPLIAKLIPRDFKETVIMQTGGYPLPYPVPVTSNYGWRGNPVTGDWAFHSGIDLGAPMGTPVLAAKTGRVEFAAWAGGYGNFVEIIHSAFGTRYAHLSEIYVHPGQQVLKGQQIGRVGSTGRSTGPHLHFEVIVPSTQGWATLDPASYLIRLAFVLGAIAYT